MNTLGYSKVCARWVPRQLTETHKQYRLEASFELLEYCQSDKTFLQQIVTGDETWVHHFEPESKKASMEWRHPHLTTLEEVQILAVCRKSDGDCVLG